MLTRLQGTREGAMSLGSWDIETTADKKCDVHYAGAKGACVALDPRVVLLVSALLSKAAQAVVSWVAVAAMSVATWALVAV